jgi:hypothetical protein
MRVGYLFCGGGSMAKQLDPKELVSLKELLLATSTQVDALIKIFIEKGFITTLEYFSKVKELQDEYESDKKEL